MSILNKYNKKVTFEYEKGVDRDYTTLSDLVELNGIEKQYIVEALFINTKSKFGEAPVIVSGEWLVNAPKHLTETVKQMQNDEELVNLINKRLVVFKIYSYQDNNNVKRYSVEWLELK